MIPILFKGEPDPEQLQDVNSVDLQDNAGEDLYALGDYTSVLSFSSYGIGALSDCISCEVTEERNGSYELVLKYPMTGIHFEDIKVRSIILAKPNYTDDPQPFRVYSITAPINGVVVVECQHLSYDLSGMPVLPFTATSCSQACSKLTTYAAPFTINTQVSTIADFKVDEPSSVRSWFGGKEGSLIDVYGGEWAYDTYVATLKTARGQDRGVVIRYGKNLIDFKQETNISNTWTGVLPFWKDAQSGQIVRANVINVAGNFTFRRILVLDLSNDFETAPTPGQLKARAQSYITSNNIGVPKVNLKVDWAQSTDRVDLCDTVKVVFEKLGVETTAKCISTTWDVLKDRYSEIEIGDERTDLADTIVGLQDEDKKIETSVSDTMLRAINNATALITGNDGGYVILHSDDGGSPYEILVMDTPDINTATKVWRWNKSGFGYSSSGYGGTYGLAITMDGAIVADYITTGTLSAININGVNITGSTINNGSGTFQVDTLGNVTANSLTSSNATITGGTIDINTDNFADGIILQNTAGTTRKKLTASSFQQYLNNVLTMSITPNSISVPSGTISANNISATELQATQLYYGYGQVQVPMYIIGGSLSVGLNEFPGVIISSGTVIRFTIPLDKPVASSVTTVTMSGSVTVRGINGTVIEQAVSSFQSSSASIRPGIGIYCTLTMSSAPATAANNTPVVVQTASGFTLTFSS